MKTTIALASGLLAALSLTPRLYAAETLRNAFANKFMIGAALNESQFNERDHAQDTLIKAQFNSITPENVMKWERIHPESDKYEFGPADQYVAFGEKNHMYVIGHTLVWHQQTPRWVFQDEKGEPADRDTLLNRMSNHIHTVVGRYRGRVKGWDVVNEALNEDGTMRQSPWLKTIGDDYLIKAFEFAHAADPDAELYYNDFSIENEPKRNGAVALVRELQAAGIPIAGIGTQTHAKLDWPKPELVDETLTAFGKLGVKVMITELDIDVLPARSNHRSAEVSRRETADPSLNPYTEGLPKEVQEQLAKRYEELFATYVKHADKISRITFWGVTDGDSWLNNWPIRGRKNYPLLFNRNCQPKPAYQRVLSTAKPE